MENNSWRLNSMDQKPDGTQHYWLRKCTRKRKERECCMCGDVGFQNSLFRCHRCHCRYQHIYCSRLYCNQLELDGVNVCDWCLDLEAKEKIRSQKRKVELQEKAIENPKRVNDKPTLKLHVKFGGSQKNELLSCVEDSKLSTKSCRNLPGTPQSNPTKGGLGRRYKLLSDVLY